MESGQQAKEGLNEEEEEEEYVLLDLDGVSDQIPIPPNAPYVLSGLDTLNPILTIDNKIRLIGDYEETIGTCYIFTENDVAIPVHKGSESSETNVIRGKRHMDRDQTPTKQINPVTSLNKILKFRPLLEADGEHGRSKQVHEASRSSDS